jgi:FMN phosphatase YigB (HAD superfamily)
MEESRESSMNVPNAAHEPVVFLLDVDRVIEDLQDHLTHEVGASCAQRYWAIFEELRGVLGYADYLGALQRYRMDDPRDQRALAVSSFLLDYSFAQRLYPGALETVAHLARWGPTVIVTDGDVVFQPYKVKRSGLFEAVDGRVLVYVHKEQQMRDIETRYPASHYVIVDDKMRLLTAFKRAWGDRVTTVFPRQGHYARDAEETAAYPPPDLTIERIDDLLTREPPPGVRPHDELA